MKYLKENGSLREQEKHKREKYYEGMRRLRMKAKNAEGVPQEEMIKRKK